VILCDTNILIEFYKGAPAILESLRTIELPNLAISVITAGELYYGAKDRRELRKIKAHLSLLHQIAIDEEISAIFLDLLETYSLSHKISIPDALIAATAIRLEIPLYTLNVKDFRYIPNLLLHAA